MLRLNLCSGGRPFKRPQWTNVDANPDSPDVDVVADVRKLSSLFGEATADMIVIHHGLEHFDQADRDGVLAACHGILAPGGSLIVIVPDMWALTERWREGRLSDDLFLVNVYGPYAGHEEDRHKCAYTPRTLDAILRRWFPCVVDFDWRHIDEGVAGRDWWFFGKEAIK